MRNIISRTLLVIWLGLPLAAQTIRPVLSEYRKEANGNFQLVNDSFLPVNVVLEPKSFTVSETGEISYRPLDPGIHVKFATTSFRIPPKQSYTISYRATADSIPAWFVVYAGMRGLPVRTSTGMAIQILLPHTVYILPKKDAAKSEIKVLKASFDKASSVVSLELASESSGLGRVLVTMVHGGKKSAEAPGFPIYPKKHRKLDVQWKEMEMPDRVVFQFLDFKIQAPITAK